MISKNNETIHLNLWNLEGEYNGLNNHI